MAPAGAGRYRLAGIETRSYRKMSTMVLSKP
jgi:hypothetical protein